MRTALALLLLAGCAPLVPGTTPVPQVAGVPGTDAGIPVEAPPPTPPPSSSRGRVSLSVEGVPVPTALADKRRVVAASRARVGDRDVAIGFSPVLREGDRLGDVVFGTLHDVGGKPIAGEGGPRVCGALDYSGLWRLPGGLAMVSHFECQPGAIYVTDLAQDPATGALSATATRPVDLAPIGGGNLFCAGTATPWGSHLAGEEYEEDALGLLPDGRLADEREGWSGMAPYWEGDLRRTHPWGYGWMVEVPPPGPDGALRAEKRLAMGRFSHELGVVLPDRRTVYLSDDGPNTALFLFVADRPDDLSAGHLYAARWTARGEAASGGDPAAGAFDLAWVPLGHARDEDVAAVAAGRDFAALFDVAAAAAGACPAGFSSVNTSFGHECLRVRDGALPAASRLEARRTAAALGATTELLKTEGLAVDADRGRVYLAVSSVDAGMTANHPEWDAGGPDHLRLASNPCGMVVALRLAGGVRDAGGAPIDSPWVATAATPAVTGRPTGERACDPEGIANPDNLAYLPGSGLLAIAEDTSRHENAALWLADVETGALVRVLTAPLGAEVSGLAWTPDVNGWGYLSTTIQHPFSSFRGKTWPGGATPEERRSIAGVLGPFPSLEPR